MSHNLENAGVYANLATGKSKGIGGGILKHDKLPLGMRDDNDLLEAVCDPRDRIGETRIIAYGLVALHFLKLTRAVTAHELVGCAHGDVALFIDRWPEDA